MKALMDFIWVKTAEIRKKKLCRFDRHKLPHGVNEVNSTDITAVKFTYALTFKNLQMNSPFMCCSMLIATSQLRC